MRNLVTCILIFILTATAFGQISYSGPVQGTTGVGVTVNTNNFLTYSNDRPFRFRMFANQRITDLEDPIDQEQPLAPEGSNLFMYPNFKETSLTEDNMILFSSFNGIEETNSIPPDPYLAIGPNHIIQTVNIDFRITDKNGNNAQTINGNTWFKSVYTQANVFDPKVCYDHFSNRWIMVWLHQDDNALEGVYLLSVSDDEDPNGVWFNWVLPSNMNGNTPSNSWGDYQGVGFDDKAIYFTSNQFSFTSSYQGSKVRIIPKSQVYVSSNPGIITYTDLYNITYPVGGANAFGIRPVRMQTASDVYYLAVHSPYTSKSNFGFYKLANPLSTTPSLTGVSVPVTAYSTPPDPNQLGGGSPLLDGGGANLRNEPVFKDGFIHLTHAAKVGNYSGVRYLAVNMTTNSAVVDMVVGDNNYFHTYPAIAVSGDDDVMLTYSKVSADSYIGAYYTIIPSSTGVPSQSIELQAGKGNYVKTYSGTRNRWGDYNGAWTDPSDSDNFFIFTEYAASTNTWGCWLGGVRIKPYPNVTAFFNNKSLDYSYSEITLPTEIKKVKIYNYGVPALNISNIQSSSVNFVIQNNLTFPITLNSFEFIELEVVFTPTEEKAYIDSIVVTSDDYDEPTKSVQLTGIGYSVAPVSANVLYSTSGSSSLCKLISVDPTNAQATLIGQSTIGKLFSLTVEKESKQLYSLVDASPNSKIARIHGLTGNGVVYKDLGLSLKAIAFDKDDILYGVDTDANLYTINIANSTYELKTTLDLSVNAMTFDPITNLLWVSTDSTTNKDRVYTVDVTTGKSTLIGGTTLNFTISSLAFDKRNNLFGLILKTFQKGTLININKTTGVAAELGTTNYAATLGLAILTDTLSAVNDDNNSLPNNFNLSQNYPNPFNPSTTISFNLPVNADVKLTVFNVLGEQIQVLLNQNMSAGTHNVVFNAKSLKHKDLTSGMYMYTLKAIANNGKEFLQTKKMLLIK
ncbi:MAG: T9SS type A sorting domain-containing protein [bacterium]